MEETYERILIERAAARKIPLSGSLELLPLCNMNCDMCYVRLTRAEMERQGRMRTAEEWLSLAKQMQDAGTLFLILTGGEPLLHPQFREIYRGLLSHGIIMTINTNGTLIDAEWASFFASMPPRRINVTLYGADAKTYETLCHNRNGYEQACRGIRLLRERGIDVKVNGSLVKNNAAAMDHICAFARSQGAAVNIDTYMYPAVRERSRQFQTDSRLTPEEAAAGKCHFLRLTMGEDAYRKMVQETLCLAAETPEGTSEPGPMRCQAGKTSFTINWQGEMRPCVMLKTPAYPVFELGFSECWKRLQEETGKIRLSPVCSACSLRAVCQTCAASALYEGGSFDAVPDYLCRYTRAFLKILKEE